jgi:long-chain fatty acid transport protein
MAGASTGYALDAAGAMYWNPATLSRLQQSEVVIGGALPYADIYLNSGIPGTGLSGRTRSDSGIGLLTGTALAYLPENSRVSYGLGLYSLGGGAVNYPGDPTNPLLSPVGPRGQFVLGPSAATASFIAVVPGASYQVTDRLAVGFAPMIDIAITSFDPAFFGPPNDANGDGLRSFPTGSHSRPFWGGGFRAGLVYSVTPTLDVGFGYTSQQWFERWVYNTRDEVGNPFRFGISVTLPAIYSWGVTYRGIDRLTLSADLRYIDYQNTQLYGEPVSAGGAGWQSVFAAAVGAQYQVTDKLASRFGYVYNDNPIPETLTLLNTQGPAITQHTLTFGFGYRYNEWLELSGGYAKGFHNSISGPVAQRTGIGTKLDVESDTFQFGITVKFGPPRQRSRPACTECYNAPPADVSRAEANAPPPIPSAPGS